jgi:hypothetical protein
MVMAELLRELSGVTYDVNSSVMVGKSQLLINPNKMVVTPLNRKVRVLRKPTHYGTTRQLSKKSNTLD